MIGPADLAALEEKLTRLRAGDIAVLAGSVPLSLAGDPYADLMAHLAGRGLRFVVDTTGAQLRSVLPLQPFLVKPNGQELGELFGVRIASAAEAAKYATRLQELGPGMFWSPWARRGRYWRTRPGASGSSPPAGARR